MRYESEIGQISESFDEHQVNDKLIQTHQREASSRCDSECAGPTPQAQSNLRAFANVSQF